MRKLCFLFLALMSVGAQAGLFRAYLSVNGLDSNACTLPAPCRLLPAALAAVNDGGEVWMLDSGNFNVSTVDVTKSVTILAVPGQVGSLVANGGHALSLGAPDIKVILRNLSFGNLAGGGFGIYFFQGAALTVEDSQFFGLPGGGIAGGPAGATLVVKNSVIRESLMGMEISNTVKATLDRVQIVGSSVRGLRVLDGAQVTLSNSTVSGTGDVGIDVQASSGTASALIDRCRIVENSSVGVYSSAFGAGAVAQVTVTRSILSGNNHGGASSASGGASATLVIDDDTISHNTTAGILITQPGVVSTRGNNVFNFNGSGSANVSGGTLTTLPGQ